MGTWQRKTAIGLAATLGWLGGGVAAGGEAIEVHGRAIPNSEHWSPTRGTLQVHLKGEASREQAAVLEELWRSGQTAAFEAGLAELDDSSEARIDYRPNALTSTTSNGDDWMLDYWFSGAYKIDFDQDNLTGNVFAFVHYNGGYGVYLSPNGGRNWWGGYSSWFVSGVDDKAMDFVAVDGHVYVTTQSQYEPHSLWVRRFNAVDLEVDSTFAMSKLFEAPPGVFVKEVKLTSNNRSGGGWYYLSALLSDGTLMFGYTPTSAGNVLLGDAPLVTDAANGLDLTWNAEAFEFPILMSYRTHTGAVKVLRHSSVTSWQEVLHHHVRDLTSHQGSSISAHGDHVVVGYKDVVGYHDVYQGLVSHDAGGTWDTPLLASDPNNRHLGGDVCLEGGHGMTVISTVDNRTAEFHQEVGYSAASWEAPLRFSDQPVRSDLDVGIGWVKSNEPGEYFVYLVGYITPDRKAFVDRISNCAGDATGDGLVDLSDMADVLADFGAVAAPGTFPGDLDWNGRVDIEDLGIILARFGESCL